MVPAAIRRLASQGHSAGPIVPAELIGGLVVFVAVTACHQSDGRPTEPANLPPSAVVGPQASIICPAGAVDILVGQDIQTAVTSRPANTTFCLKSGVHRIAASITPRTGDIFVGEYGAIIDGTGWRTPDPNQAAFRAHDQDIDGVTIRNLVIRNMPAKGVHATWSSADRWTIEYNEVTNNTTGVAAPNRSMVRNNHIHHNTGGGYSAFRAVGTTFENNEIAYNGSEQKIVGATSITFRNNFVHHNAADGIWYDADNTGSLIEDNRVEDNGREGIFYEISGQGVIRRNLVRRSETNGIFISTSKDVEIYENTLEDNFRGIQYFLNCEAVGGGTIRFDLANNLARDNTIRVGRKDGAYANGFAHLSGCSPGQVAPYLDGSRGLRFRNNRYVVPSMESKYWLWGLSGLKSWTESLSWGPTSLKTWTEWQALGHDIEGAVTQ